MSIEALAKATRSSNLSWSDHETKDVDWLTAGSLCGGLQARLPGSLARLMGGAPFSFWPVIEAIEHTLAKKRRLSHIDRSDIQDALLWWMNPVCRVCQGCHPEGSFITRIKIPDTPMLGDICHACGGSGKSDHPVNTTVYAESLKMLDAAKVVCERLIRNKLG